MRRTVFLISVFILLFPLSCTFAQPIPQPRQSPLDITSMRYQDTYVKITYGQPAKQGREIFGGLVPYDKVWRTGANEATEITLTKDIFVNGVILPAGTYSVFTIPERIKWTIIINRAVGLWGDYNYDPGLDVMRFDVAVQELGQVCEQFTIRLDQNNDRAEWIMMWDRVKVAIPIRFSIDNEK